ncbi:glycosyltransferase [Paraconexibacter algicola]|uniref:Glycosyl transferase family 1 n=1 Tax=Paraconexibacter algicola TaxID=2133960 RepID=A0A2T4UIQ2_9ACTN|nr:glycosyltransferase [Paraconexibacter algicola]PTL59120.1 glycosyl transferase family 1 [Paraconexibacter algicola]
MEPRAYFVCPDTDVPSGGVRVVYRAVDHCNDAGIPAVVVHDQPGFACTWFEHATPVVCAAQAAPVPGRDLLVVPEVYGPRLGEIAPGVRKVVFNQNAYNTFHGYDHVTAPGTTAYDHPEVAGAVCVSDDNAAYLRYAFPHLDVRRITYQLDPALWFVEETGAPRPRRLTYMPRKHADQAGQVLNILSQRGALRDVEVVPLHGMNEREVAAAQRSSLVFLSFGYPEGCPFPPKEAMAAGCLVVGYHGMGGRDYFTHEHGYPVPQGDIVAFARQVEEVLDAHRADPAGLEARARTASAAIRARYTPDAERRSILEAFGRHLPGAAAPGVPLVTVA